VAENTMEREGRVSMVRENDFSRGEQKNQKTD